MRHDLPAGTVTFLFTDVEGSTKLLHELGAERYAAALAEHRRLLRGAFARHGGVEVDTQGDAFFVAFSTATGALAAAREATEALAEGPIRVRVGIHTGTPLVTEEGYVGADVHRAARIAATGHGGQVLLSAATAALVGTSDDVALVDLGEHRLKDLSAPERIYQLGDGDFPPLKSLHRTNVPVPATPFLGRERELAELGELLAREDVRLVTLTGPGGTGKTRLALQAAGAAADRFPGGVFWVPLAPLRDPALVLETAASALGGQGELHEQIAHKRLLMLFDNFEHLVGAAAELSPLLARCPNLTLLVTSREPLRLAGEWEYAVDPLQEQEAVALFKSRARAVKRDFAADGEVREICARLDNLPLAIELAAARVKLLSPRALLERLERRLPVLAGGARDIPERQRTLRATIEWSHELLSPDEQRLFRRLAIFRGGWTLEAAEEVCEAELDTLASLVDKSLVRVRDDERFFMLETIREYAAEQLEASEEAEELRGRHAEHFLGVAEEAEPMLLGGDPAESLDRLEADHDNIRTALEWLQEAGDTQPAMRLAGAVWEFWCLRGHAPEGWRHLERLLRADETATSARAKALTGAAHLAPQVGADDDICRRLAEQALALHRELGDEWGVAYALVQLAGAISDLERAQELYEQSVHRLRELGDEHHALQANRALAWIAGEVGDIERYVALNEDNLRRARMLGNSLMEARALASLGVQAGYEGRFAEAVALLKEAYRLDRVMGQRTQVALDLCRLAQAFGVAGRAEPAVWLAARADALAEELGVTLPSWGTAMRDEGVSRARERLTDDEFATAWQRGRSMGIDEAVALALEEAPDA